MQAMQWEGDSLLLLDQTKLPTKVEYLRCTTHQMVADAICRLVVRGAPAIGVAAAYGMALGALEYKGTDKEGLYTYLQQVRRTLAETRPTAVNLFWALQRMQTKLDNVKDKPVAEIRAALTKEAQLMEKEDIETNRAIGYYGNAIVPDQARILTHCNAGALATCGYGTALGVIRAAHEAGKGVHVFADETRPLLQGARLTAFELMEDGIPVTLITDNMAGWVMHKGMVDLVIFGADRIAANGDTANKIGSYSVAVLAKENGIPVYSAAPLSSIDINLCTGDEIPVEERDPKEVTHLGGIQVAPSGVHVFNPAFDVTLHQYLDGIITEVGILRPPFERSISAALAARATSTTS
ncbi:MAG: S-methyl-5-thioribose-1-phosphate isomerase [Firmicutes bacterium]|nr:S-methyl-5-thioribose-1-phosphate isomerase [Bacillota bacterium]